MNVKVIHNPVKILVFEDIFSKEVNQKIYKEAILIEKKFEDSVIGKGLDKNFRSNKTCYYDTVYSDRSKSALLSSVDSLYSSNTEFREIVTSFGYPFDLFFSTNTHETQVSNYGRQNETYKYHIDKMGNSTRAITFVYYFFKEPKQFKGGEIEFTNSPIYLGKAIVPKADKIILKPKNNMGVVFSSTTPHHVHSTTSKDFKSGRFSVNSWIGFK